MGSYLSTYTSTPITTWMMNVASLLSKQLCLKNQGISIETAYITFKSLPEAGKPGVIEFIKNSTLACTILFRFSKDSQTLVAWSSLSEETPSQQFSIVSVEGGVEIMWTDNCHNASRFVEMTPIVSVTEKCRTAMQTPRKHKCAISYFKRVLLPKKRRNMM